LKPFISHIGNNNFHLQIVSTFREEILPLYISKMGSICGKITHKHEIESLRFLFLGLDHSGKTTIMYRLALGQVVSTLPTIGPNEEVIKYRGAKFITLDCGGKDKVRPLWYHYFHGVGGVIFVLDANDRERLAEAKEELFKLLNEKKLQNVPFLILANKQDVEGAMTIAEVQEKLELASLTSIKWHLEGTSATTGQGLEEGMEWLYNSIS